MTQALEPGEGISKPPAIVVAIPMAICRCCSGRRRGSGARFAGIVHHTDAEREWAYDREAHVGKLDKAWDTALKHGWTVVSM